MAKIQTKRPEAAQYNGRTVKFVREVMGGPAYDPLIDQVIVELEDGPSKYELYFFANEVALDKDELKTAEQQKKDATRTQQDMHKRSEEAYANKQKLFAGYKRDADKRKSGDEPKAPPESPFPDAGYNPQNRMPTDRPYPPQTETPPKPVSQPKAETAGELPPNTVHAPPENLSAQIAPPPDDKK